MDSLQLNGLVVAVCWLAEIPHQAELLLLLPLQTQH